MAGMKDTFVTFALAGLFVLAFFSFIYTTQINNDSDETILANSILNKTVINLNNELSTYKEKSETQSNSQDLDDPKTEGGSLLFLSIIGTGKVIKGMIVGVYNTIIVLPSDLFGVPQVVIAVITGIVGILIILGAWRLYKAGE